MTNSPIAVIAGATGKLGRLVARSLQARGAHVRALVRDPNKPEARALAASGASVTALDLANAGEADLAGALAGASAVISTLQGGPEVIVDAQLALLRAAARAQVRRMFSSTYSFNLFTLPPGENINSDWRRTFADRAREQRGDVEVVHVMQGIFADAEVLGFVGVYDRASNALSYWGDGATPIDWTTWEDTAEFVAAAALDERPVPEQLFVAGDRMSVLELAKLLAATRGQPALTARGTLDELRAEIARRRAAEPGNMYAWLPLMYAAGMFGGQAVLGPLANARYPEVRAESVRDALQRGAM